MAKRKAGGNPGLRTLRARYKANAQKIKTIASRDTEYQTYIRAYRSEIASAKKAGLLSKDIDARKALPSASISKALGRAERVISGESKTQKVSPKMAKELRGQGYTVVGDRVILAKGTRINSKGQEVESRSSGDITTRLIRARADIEVQAKEIFDNLKKDESVVITLPAGNSSNYFGPGTLERFLSYATRYLDGGPDNDGRAGLEYIGIVKFPNRKEAIKWDEKRAARQGQVSAVRKQLKRLTRSTKKRAKVDARKKRSRKKRDTSMIM
jgi:hypothetical protein